MRQKRLRTTALELRTLYVSDTMWLFLKSTHLLHPSAVHHDSTDLKNSGTPWGVRHTRLTSTGLGTDCQFSKPCSDTWCWRICIRAVALFLRWLQQIAFQVWPSYKNVGQWTPVICEWQTFSIWSNFAHLCIEIKFMWGCEFHERPIVLV